MKLHADRASAHTIQAYGKGWISVNGERIRHSVVLSSLGTREPWHCEALEDLTPEHFEQLLAHRPEVVIFGSGTTLRFVHPSLHASLMSQRVGLETMDTLAACRTYNILAQEGRQVVVALLMELQPA
jgi:uncharacterized protein